MRYIARHSRQSLQAFLAGHDLMDADPIIALHHYHFSARYHAVVDDHLDRLIHRAVQLDDGAGGELEDILQGEFHAAKRYADRQFHIEEQIERAGGWGGYRLGDRTVRF